METVAFAVGAGDVTGGAIARRFAKGGINVCATGAPPLEKLCRSSSASRPKAAAHGFASVMRARKKRSPRYREDRVADRPDRCWCSTSGPTPSRKKPRATRSGKWPASPVFSMREVVLTKVFICNLFTGATASISGARLVLRGVRRLAARPARWRRAYARTGPRGIRGTP